MADARIAAAVVAGFVAGYLNEFYVIRSIIALVRGDRLEKAGAVLAAGGIVLSLAIIAFGFGSVLLLATGVYFIVDALILRFR